MDLTANSPQSSGETPESHVNTRRNARLETQTYPVNELYRQFPLTTMPSASSSLFVTDQDSHLGGQQEFPMVNHIRDNDYGLAGFAPSSVAYPSMGYHHITMNAIAMESVFGPPAQSMDGGYHPSGTPTASTSDPFPSGLQSENDTQNAATNVYAETPDSSTVPEDMTTGSSSSPVLPSDLGSQQPCMSVWNPEGSNASEGRRKRRRKMTGEELVRNRALKAAGGACETCRRRKKKCTHKDDQLILSAPASTPASIPAHTSTPAPAIPAPAPIPSHRVSTTNRHNLVPRTRVVRPRPRPDDINRRAAPVPQHHHHQQQQQQHNPSVSSYGHTLDPSMFSPSEGGASSNGTMSSTQSDANTFAIEYHPELGVEEQIGLDTAGFGQQFNGQPAPEFDPMNAENALGTLEQWLREHTNSNRD